MGEVYKAHDPRLGREVAIKVLPSAFSADPERLHRFEQEARAAAALNHPNILAVHDIGQHDGAPYIVSELLEGETLRERLHGGALPVRKAVEYAVQIAHGLAAAHEKGITHRDLKPENIFVTSDERVKILDFGLAKLTQAEPSMAGASELPTTPPNTLPGVVLGTIGYMAPEQVRGLTADHRSDIFAFGAILYEMLSGRRAFRGDTTADTMTAILKEDPPDLATSERHIPPALARIADHCLEKSPTARFKSADDLAFALEALSAHSGANEATISATVTPKRKRRERLAWALVAVAVLAVGVLAVPVTLYVRRAEAEPVVTRFDVVTPPTSDAFSFALSPDGRQLVFVATAEGGSRLWLRPLDQVTARALAGTEDASMPFWSPDGRAIGFFADGKLKRLDLAGGALQVLADTPQGRGGTWNRDGVIVFGTANSGLMRVTATGGIPVPVTRRTSGQDSHRFPQFLPDDRRVLFTSELGQPDTNGVYLASLDGGEPTRVLAEAVPAAYVPPGYLLWVRQGALFVQRFDAARATMGGEPVVVAQGVEGFSESAGVLAHRADVSNRRQLVSVDRMGKELGVVGAPDEAVLASPDLASDGQRVAVSRIVQGNGDVWLIDIGRGLASRFTFNAVIESRPVWSPDGSRVVFGSERIAGVHDLFEKPTSGVTDEQPLLVTPQDKAALDWTPDGRVLLYSTQDPKTASDLWALPLIGERKPFPVVNTSFDEIAGQLSPDGRWLAYASNESGRYEIYLRPFPEPGGKWQISTTGGIQPRWRRDGQELFYVAPDTRLMAAPIRPASAARTVETGTPVALFPTRLASSGGAIFATGFASRAQYAVAADGRFLMNVAVEGATASPITIVLNWAAGLTK